MKAFLRTIALGYFYCGIALGFVVWASYVWGFQAAVSAEVPLGERLKATVNIQPMIALDTGTRVIAWAPSLAIWAAASNEETFAKWLAPGFYVRRLSPSPGTGARTRP